MAWDLMERSDGTRWRVTEYMTTSDLQGRSGVPAIVDPYELERYVQMIATVGAQAAVLLLRPGQTVVTGAGGAGRRRRPTPRRRPAGHRNHHHRRAPRSRPPDPGHGTGLQCAHPEPPDHAFGDDTERPADTAQALQRHVAQARRRTGPHRAGTAPTRSAAGRAATAGRARPARATRTTGSTREDERPRAPPRSAPCSLPSKTAQTPGWGVGQAVAPLPEPVTRTRSRVTGSGDDGSAFSAPSPSEQAAWQPGTHVDQPGRPRPHAPHLRDRRKRTPRRRARPDNGPGRGSCADARTTARRNQPAARAQHHRTGAAHVARGRPAIESPGTLTSPRRGGEAWAAHCAEGPNGELMTPCRFARILPHPPGGTGEVRAPGGERDGPEGTGPVAVSARIGRTAQAVSGNTAERRHGGIPNTAPMN